MAALPAGRDPADVWRDDPAALAAAVRDARPFLEFRVDRIVLAGDLSSLEARAAVAERAAALVAEHPSELVRDQYVVQLAERLSLDIEAVRSAVTRAVRRVPIGGSRTAYSGAQSAGGTERAAAMAGAGRAPDPDRREVEALRLAVHEPERLSGRLIPELFGNPLVRGALDALGPEGDLHAALTRANDEERALLERLAVEEPPMGEDPDAYVASVMVQLVESSARRRLDELVRAGDDSASEMKHLLDELVTARTVSSWSAANRVADQLVPWVLVSPKEPR